MVMEPPDVVLLGQVRGGGAFAEQAVYDLGGVVYVAGVHTDEEFVKALGKPAETRYIPIPEALHRRWVDGNRLFYRLDGLGQAGLFSLRETANEAIYQRNRGERARVHVTI